MKTVAKVVNAGKLAVAKDYAPDEALGPRVVVPVLLGLYPTQARHRPHRIFRHIVRPTAALPHTQGARAPPPVGDVRDDQGDAEAMGKNVGDDLAEGKTTLPLIHAMAKGDEQQATLVRQAIREGGLDDLSAILEIVRSTGALDYTMDKAREQAALALACLKDLADSPHRSALQQLTEVAVARIS